MFATPPTSKPTTQLSPASPARPLWARSTNLPATSSPTIASNKAMRERDWKSPTPGTESDVSVSSSAGTRCLCGNSAEDGGIYCSIGESCYTRGSRQDCENANDFRAFASARMDKRKRGGPHWHDEADASSIRIRMARSEHYWARPVQRTNTPDCARSDAFSSLCYKPGQSSRHVSEPRAQSSDPIHSSAWSGNMVIPPSTTNIGAGPLSAPLTSTRRDPYGDCGGNGDGGFSLGAALQQSQWDSSSHYRRVARADLRREERRAERKKRRAEGSSASTSSRCTTQSTASTSRSCPSHVPSLVGGIGIPYSHSRNASTASTASTAMSDWTGFGGSLSRNPSTASNTSAAGRRYRGDAVEVIREDEDEEYLLSTTGHDELEETNAALYNRLQTRRPSNSKKRPAEAMGLEVGLGKDMRDILEEIISMEQSFSVDDDDEDELDGRPSTRVWARSASATPPPARAGCESRMEVETGMVSPLPGRHASRFATLPRAALPPHANSYSLAQAQPQMNEPTKQQTMLGAMFDRAHPPRTPSPAPLPTGDRKRRAPDAPGAPIRGHRSSMSVGHLFAPPSVLPGASSALHVDQYPYGAQGLEGNARLHRPPSFVMGHQSSLSESHTALYLATASPEAPAPASAVVATPAETSPLLRMKSRNSLTFTPDAAGPALPIPPSLAVSFEGISNVNTTPSRRRPGPSPNANYASMGGWRFPSAGSTVQMQTPVKVPAQAVQQTQTQTTPLGAAHQASRSLRAMHRYSGMSLDSPASARKCRSGSGSRSSSDNGCDGTTTPLSATDAQMQGTAQMREFDGESYGRAAPHLLWPPPRHLEPSLFPTSPASFMAAVGNDYNNEANSGATRFSASGRPGYVSPPTSGLKLGVLLGSGNGSAGSRSSAGSDSRSSGMGMDVDGECDDGHMSGELAYLRA